MRQSWRGFASAPVRHSDEISDGVSPRPTCCSFSEPSSPSEPPPLREREQEVSDDPDDAEPAAAEREPAGPHAATAGVGDLAGVESRSGTEAHRRCVPRPRFETCAPGLTSDSVGNSIASASLGTAKRGC